MESIYYTGEPDDDRERRLVQSFRRQDGFVLIKERLLKDRIVGCPLQKRTRTRYSTEIDAEVADRAVDPAALDPDLWPESRQLPVVRWYRVTFLLGCGLTVALVRRGVMSGRADNGRRLRKPSEASRAELDGRAP